MAQCLRPAAFWRVFKLLYYLLKCCVKINMFGFSGYKSHWIYISHFGLVLSWLYCCGVKEIRQETGLIVGRIHFLDYRHTADVTTNASGVH